jgi:hypothetical protein
MINMKRRVALWLQVIFGLSLLVGILLPRGAAAQWANESTPLPPQARVAAAPLRVGLQAGHWKSAEVPDELERIRTSTGASYGGRSEWQLNLDIAQRTATILRGQGILVDVLPATVPTGYQADAFISLHADANSSARARGYKVATRWRSAVAWRDQILMEYLGSKYAQLTGLPLDPSVTRGMRGYYAFNTYLGTEYRVGRTTPAAIIEMGFMTSAADRALLFDQPGRVANAVAQGILAYLHNASTANAIQRRAEVVAADSPTERSVIAISDGVRVRTANDGQGTVIRTVNRGDVLTYADAIPRPPPPHNNPGSGPSRRSTELAAGGWTKVTWPGFSGDAYISRDLSNIQEFDEP